MYRCQIFYLEYSALGYLFVFFLGVLRPMDSQGQLEPINGWAAGCKPID